MTARVNPEFRELTLEECYAFLTSQKVGRLAFTLHDRVDIQPINYISDGEWIFGRTSQGSKLATLMHNPWCAFEIDEVRDVFDWASVVVKGTFHILDPKLGSLFTFQRAEKLLRTLLSGSFSLRDPVAHRNVVFGIFVNEITGRAAGR